MKKIALVILAGLLAISVGCKNESGTAADAAAKTTTATSVPAAAGISGTVVETMDASGYTYVQVDTGSEKIWAAGPKTALKVGDKVSMPAGSPIQNFKSKTLDREFEQIFFVSAIIGGDQDFASAAAGAGDHTTAAAPAVISFEGIAKAVDGQTVVEIFTSKNDLGGKGIMLRGKVVKSMSNIMGKNWLHIQDGTGSQASKDNDLTITTASTAKVGDTVLVSGVLILDKDFGSGYKYDLIVEDAKITIE